MTGPNPGPNVFPTVQRNPDGTPNYQAAAATGYSGPSGGGSAPAGVAGSAGRVYNWSLPKGLANKPLWFDTGHGTTTTVSGSSRLSPDFGVTSSGAQGHVVSSPTSKEILESPQKIFDHYAAMAWNNPDAYLRLQAALANGPWGKVDPTGAFDANTQTALGNAMLEYLKLTSTGVGVSFNQYLVETGRRAQALGGIGTSGGGAGGGAGAQPHVTLMDPTSIRLAAQNAAQQALGQGLTDAQLNTFVQQFQAEQVQNAQTGGGDLFSTNTKLPGEAMAFAQKADPTLYKSNQKQTFIDQLVNMFAPTQSQRPNMQPTASV